MTSGESSRDQKGPESMHCDLPPVGFLLHLFMWHVVMGCWFTPELPGKPDI